MKTFALMSALVDERNFFTERMTDHAKTSVLNIANIGAGLQVQAVPNPTIESGEEVKYSSLTKIF